MMQLQYDATIEDRTTDDKQINYKVYPGRILIISGAYFWLVVRVRTKNVWWAGNQGILGGVGNRHDNT